MFAKLLKYEWNASRKLMTILTLAMLGVGVLATVCLRGLIGATQGMVDDDNPFTILLIIGLAGFLLMSYLSALAYAIAVEIVLLYRFYKNKFTDEGYLTFTLPVKVTDIFWSSFVNMLIWVLISVVVLFAVLFGVLIFGTATKGLVNMDILRGLGEFLSILADLPWEELIQAPATVVALIIIYGLNALITPVFGLILPMASITVGSVLAKKHKILASFGIYYGATTVFGILASVASMVPVVFMLRTDNIEGLYIGTGLANLIITAGLTVGGYILSIHLMKNKLNLP